MKKSGLVFSLLTAIIVIALVFTACSQPAPTTAPPTTAPPAVKAQKLVFNTHDMESTPQSQATIWYLDEIARRSGGLVTFEKHWSGELAGSADELSALRGGALDLAAPPPAYTPNDTPLSQIVNGTRVTNSTVVAMRKGYELFWKSGEVSDLLTKEHVNNNIKLLMWLPMEYSLITKQKVTKLSDLNGLKLRSVGVFEPKQLSAYGAIPVSVLPAEWYESLSRGTIDGIPMVNESIISYKLYEVTKYKSFHAGAIMSNPVFINLNVFNKLPDKVKDILNDDTFRKDATEKFLEIFKQGTDAAMEQMKTKMEFVDVDPKEQQQYWDDWVKVTVKEFPGIVEKAGKGPEGIKVLDQWLKLVTGEDLKAWDAKLGITR
ncbi:MAG: TRAP transporter substrate-binding protein DctP [Chloroflexi bacterium]|nr:TRAP transporter substrate-binding protein DctP [Chloroflexota bacterium]